MPVGATAVTAVRAAAIGERGEDGPKGRSNPVARPASGPGAASRRNGTVRLGEGAATGQRAPFDRRRQAVGVVSGRAGGRFAWRRQASLASTVATSATTAMPDRTAPSRTSRQGVKMAGPPRCVRSVKATVPVAVGWPRTPSSTQPGW